MKKWLNIALLILAGEAVFILPFVLARVFRPTVLEVFQINNVELGACFSTYGVVAFVSYLFGGSIADKFAPRYLIAIALFSTAAGGLVYSGFPEFWTLQILYGYWGFTTIFLFWAAMLKATRIWGGSDNQGLAFGLLDGGRGLVAAGFGSLGILVFSLFLPEQEINLSLEDRQEAFSQVILVSSAIIGLVGLLILFFLKPVEETNSVAINWRDLFDNFATVIKIPAVYLLMIIILCAYTGYKITDVFSLYASDVMGMNDVESAQVGTYLLYIRPIIGVTIGLLADKTKTSLMMMLGFCIMLVGSILFAAGWIEPSTTTLFLGSILIVATGVYAFRTLYFAALQEGQIPVAVTGTAIGLISLVGYTPDIFMGPAIGYFLDGWPGERGHQYVFMMLAVFSLIGLVAATIFSRISSDK
ncbi:MFS transporter [Nonlabens ponticola]|uniref:MFS transporter n=1 Tax=Nonlabens ponticola TaxID=2496866 RepID=A0A3S9MYV3_9FLAO|nr:MFS transporter [Nonlabens ponticola]AZQ44329.1 MFS transporter [Nonlabens ponticola]